MTEKNREPLKEKYNMDYLTIKLMKILNPETASHSDKYLLEIAEQAPDTLLKQTWDGILDSLDSVISSQHNSASPASGSSLHKGQAKNEAHTP